MFALGYMNADMTAVTDYYGNVMGSAKVLKSWRIDNSALSTTMHQVECRIAGRLYTGRTLGAMMAWNGKAVAEKQPTGFALLTRPDSQPKAVKGQKKGVMTFVLHLAPASLSGFNVCPMATPACTAGCLNTAGRGRFDGVQAARIRKSKLFFNDRAAFMAALHRDIMKAVRYATRRGFDCAVRLNGTSDIAWHRVSVAGAASIMECFPTVQFYDYTKVTKRVTVEQMPRNYHLTFSLSENNDNDAANVLRAGGTVAVVLRNRKAVEQLLVIGSYTIAGHTAPVVDGDETDLRFLDPAGSIVLLYAKGRMKTDRTGFVRDL